jgi:catechol 2,3-dioxygenase-like lactoylglutathione lyase family enzyme
MEAIMTDQNSTASPFASIRAIDYTVILVRDMAAMRRFYEGVMRFPMTRELAASWIEYRTGGNTLALARPGRLGKDEPTPAGSASLQLAFRVAPADVDRCAAELLRHGVELLEPPTDQRFGHRTLFFRDPDGNLLEVYAEI